MGLNIKHIKIPKGTPLTTQPASIASVCFVNMLITNQQPRRILSSHNKFPQNLTITKDNDDISNKCKPISLLLYIFLQHVTQDKLLYRENKIIKLKKTHISRHDLYISIMLKARFFLYNILQNQNSVNISFCRQ